jgi:uncharacterized protein YegP (UPF0339 family)
MSEERVHVGRDLAEVYEAEDGWRWRYVCGDNGKIMAGSHQGYSNKEDCIGGARRVTGLTVRFISVEQHDMEDAESQ